MSSLDELANATKKSTAQTVRSRTQKRQRGKPMSGGKKALLVLGGLLAIGAIILCVQMAMGRDIQFEVYRAELDGVIVVLNTSDEPIVLEEVEVNERYRWKRPSRIEPGKSRVVGSGMLADAMGSKMRFWDLEKVTVTVSRGNGVKTKVLRGGLPLLPSSR